MLDAGCWMLQAAGSVQVILFHLRGRGWLETQQMMETHCLHRYRGWAEWVAHDDIDEFFQPLSGHPTIASVVKDLEKSVVPPISAFQVCAPTTAVILRLLS